eukprot:1793315-Amphidinium_carterae.5
MSPSFQAGWCESRDTDWHPVLPRSRGSAIKKGCYSTLVWTINANAWSTFKEQLAHAYREQIRCFGC